MKEQGFKELLDRTEITPYRLSKLINYNMSSVYKLYSGDTRFTNIQLWVAKRIADVLFNGDITALYKAVEHFNMLTIQEQENKIKE